MTAPNPVDPPAEPGQEPPAPEATSFGPPVPNPAQLTAQPAAPVVVSAAKSGGVAVLLSLLLTGAGHWYTGEIGRGFAFLGATILAAFSLLFLIGIVALPVISVWAAIDAKKSAERHNVRVAAARQQLALAR